MRLELEIALAYLRSRRSRLVSSVSLLAVGGIALGVMALVIAMGLLSGYRSEIREKLIGANAAVVVYPLSPANGDAIRDLRARLGRTRRVRATAPVIYQTGLAASSAAPDGLDAVIKGIDPAAERDVSPQLETYLPDPAAALRSAPGEPPPVAVGFELARALDVRVGDAVTLSVPDASAAADRSFVPRTGRFRVARIFRTNFAEYDAQWVFCDRTVLRALSGTASDANVVEVRLDRADDLGDAEAEIRRAAGGRFSVADTLSMNEGLFSALKIQQTTLFLVIGLIVAVSTFNVVATLVMTVREKRRDIGVLAALGADPRLFTRVFLYLGALLGGGGILAGAVFGTAACWALTAFRLLRFPPGVAEIYFVSFIPFRVVPGDLAAIVVFSGAAILSASWLSARRASRVDIAEALRYE